MAVITTLVISLGLFYGGWFRAKKLAEGLKAAPAHVDVAKS
jgi:hypothetical protein